jgi:hypothetical protein
MFDSKLFDLEPGLLKINFTFNGNPQQELVWKLPPQLADLIFSPQFGSLPNDVLCYRFWLRDRMKSKDMDNFYDGPFMGSKLRDEHIERIEGRIISLKDSFFAGENIAAMLVPCNLPRAGYYTIRDGLYDFLKSEGFDADNSHWDDYKKWELERLSTFK